ncbi:uncharacterized protein BDV14DRAFT_191656 [Aspergillus stella-maris]|uniref:uncharacterized protein n=1 Tax=Aspergillus stella-maris TaxID=1810926 RepID=UPI003CCC9CFA
MANIEIASSSPASPEHPDRLLFRSHKSLPRRTNPNANGHFTQPPTNGHDGQFSDGLPTTTAPILPLTPLSAAQDDSPTEIDVPKATPPQPAITALTPSKPSHPPTPETTPPRGMASGRPGLGHFGYISSSSRAESFQTAYEVISDAETVTPRPSPPPISRSSTQKSAKSTRANRERNDPGVRPRHGAFSDEQSSNLQGSPRAKGQSRTSSQRHEKPPRTNDSRIQELSNGNAPELYIKPTRNKSKRSRNAPDANTPGLDASTRGRTGLRERVAHVRQPEDNSAMDKFRQEICWPAADSQLTSTEREGSRPRSGVSTSSTVDALIIDSPKPARRALRHTEKRISLRSASSPITKSERTSTVSTLDLQRRLSHKPARITENDRRSISSEISVSGSSTLGAGQQSVEVVPVVVIPQRRSSLMSSSNPSSRNPSLSRSRPSSRAPMSRKSRPDSMEIARQKRRTVSDSNAKNIPADLRGRGLNRPHIPSRSSSLSAPTSQNNPRATSMTSDSLWSHKFLNDLDLKQHLLEQQNPSPAAPAPILHAPQQDKHDSADLPKTQSILIGVEDLHHLRPPSVPFTPHSIPSSSPGPFEISEVRRVAIFPHNNESLLLVNPHGQSGLRAQLQQANQPQTPETTQQPSISVESPLRNPRPPPQPPVAIAKAKTNTFGSDRRSGIRNSELGPSNDSNRQSRHKRRPWMVRPRSESFNSFVRTLSLSQAKNPKAGEDIDARLQPFWRPRRFWDDSPESLSPEEDAPQYRTNRHPDEVISNSVGMPQRRIIFNGPSVSASRAGNKRRIDDYHRNHRDALVGNRILTSEALYSQTSLHQRRFPSAFITWWRLRFRPGFARSFRQRVRRTLRQRAEDKREARREKLKQSIGEAVLMDSSTQVRKARQ